MAAWQSKKICNLLNKKILLSKSFEIIDKETVGLVNIKKIAIKDISAMGISNAIQSQEKERAALIKRIDTVLTAYSFRQHVILDKQGVVSLIICQWPYRKSPQPKIRKATELNELNELIVERNT